MMLCTNYSRSTRVAHAACLVCGVLLGLSFGVSTAVAQLRAPQWLNTPQKSQTQQQKQQELEKQQAQEAESKKQSSSTKTPAPPPYRANATPAEVGDQEEVYMDLPLPKWSPEDPSAGPSAPLGGLLMPDGYTPETNADNSASGDILLYIPQSNLDPGTVPLRKRLLAQEELQNVSIEFLQECAEMPVEEHVLDPQGFLHPTQADDLRRLLDTHAAESAISASILLLDRHQKLPAETRVSAVAGQRLAKSDACFVVYPLGEPWRVRLFMSRRITHHVPATYLRSLVHSCVQDALKVRDSTEQLQRFAIQLSIRLTWLERAHPDIFQAPPQSDADPVLAPVSVPTEEGREHDDPLGEVTLEQEAVAASRGIPASWRSWAWYGSGGLLGLVLLLKLVSIQRHRTRRQQRNSVWLLPESDTTPRYGAPHCGRGGASMKYGG